jgi:hypothetical protein
LAKAEQTGPAGAEDAMDTRRPLISQRFETRPHSAWPRSRITGSNEYRR